MADKKKGAGADNGSSTKHSKVSKIFDGLNKICCIAKELKDDTLGVEEFEKLLDNQKKLAEQLKAKDAQIASLTAEVEGLKKAKSLLWGEFDEKYQELTTELDNLRDVEKDLEETRSDLKKAEEAAAAAKNEVKKIRLGVEKTADHKKVAAEQLKSAQEALEDLRLRSTGVEVKYRELTEFVGEDQFQDPNVIELEDALEEFASMCHKEILKVFQAITVPPGPFPGSPPTDSHSMALAMQPTPVMRSPLDGIPLLGSTSKESKLMICAFVEHVFAKALIEYVFVDVWAPSAPGLQQAVSAVLGFLDSRNARREAIVRSQLLAEFADEDDGEHVVLRAFTYITSTLDPLVPSGPARANAYVELMGLLQEAVSLWTPLRRARNRISAELDVDSPQLVRTDDCYLDYGGPELGGHSPEVIAPLFPQIVRRGDILINPRVLWSDQGAVVSARDELKKVRDRSSLKGDVAPQLPKRRSSLRASMASQSHLAAPFRRPVMSPSMPPPVSGSKTREPNKGGEGGVRGTDVGGSSTGKGAACPVSVPVKLPQGGANGKKGSVAAS